MTPAEKEAALVDATVYYDPFAPRWEANEAYASAANTKAFHEASSGALREKMHECYDLIPFTELVASYNRVAEYGAKKYSPWNWTKGLPRVQLLASLLRHTFAYLRGEEIDPVATGGSGLSHVDHIVWNAVALAHNAHWKLEDNRRVEPPRAYKETPMIRG